MRTSPDDEPFTSHFPRQPCAPQPHTRPCSRATERTFTRGTSRLNSQAMRTRSSPSSTSTRQCSGTTPRSTMARFAPVNRIGKRAGIATAGA